MNKRMLIPLFAGLCALAMSAGAANAGCAHIRCSGKGDCTIRVKDAKNGGIREGKVPSGRHINITKARKGDQWCQVVGRECEWRKLPIGKCA